MMNKKQHSHTDEQKQSQRGQQIAKRMDKEKHSHAGKQSQIQRKVSRQ
jgi:hypothetical protein